LGEAWQKRDIPDRATGFLRVTTAIADRDCFDVLPTGAPLKNAG